jgi:hypothetical protein
MRETPQIDWPVVVIGQQRLTVRWSFYVQWLLSKRKVNVRALGEMIATKDPSVVDLVIECFAAAVAENYTSQGLAVPTAETWALQISADPETWPAINAAIWEAIKKARPAAATPAPQEPAQTGAPLN